MTILGIDTTFYATSAAVIENGGRVLSNIVFKNKNLSSDKLFTLDDFHIRKISSAIEKAFKKANCRMENIDLIAVSNSCSLISTVKVGVIAANLLSRVHNRAVIGIDHIEAHLFSNWLERDAKKFLYPILVFSSSGASSTIVLIKDQLKIKKINQVDIGGRGPKNSPVYLGIGSVYSNLAFQLGLAEVAGSGSLISKFAKGGNINRFKYRIPRDRKEGDLDFSWMKEENARIIQESKRQRPLSKQFTIDLCASFENTISHILSNDLIILARRYKAKEIHLAGGVSANTTFKEKLEDGAKKTGIRVRWPVKEEYSTDNAAMIASRAYYKYRQNQKKYLLSREVKALSDLKLEKIAVGQFLDENR